MMIRISRILDRATHLFKAQIHNRAKDLTKALVPHSATYLFKAQILDRAKDQFKVRIPVLFSVNNEDQHMNIIFQLSTQAILKVI